MGNVIIPIIIVLAALVGFVILFFLAEYLSKDKAGTTKRTKETEKPKPVEPQTDANKSEANPVSLTKDSESSNLSTEIEALILQDKQKSPEKPETASQRSRMQNRQERMSLYREKYKTRTVDFDENSFDEPVESSSLVVDGVEITKEDVKKLTALHGLLARKD